MSVHLDDEQFSDFVDYGVVEETELDVRSHLAECRECADALNRIAFVVSAAPESRVAIHPEQDLWPPIANATVGLKRRRHMRGALITLVVCLLILVSLSLLSGRKPLREQGRLSAIAVPQPSEAEVLAALGEISLLESDNDKREELQLLVRVVFRRNDPQTDQAFFDAANGIRSDGERRKLLLDIVERQKSDGDLTQRMIDFTAPIGSPREKSRAVIAIAQKRPIKSGHLRDRLSAVATSIGNGEDRANAIRAILIANGKSAAYGP